MREYFKFLLLVFISVLMPITLWNAANLYFEQSCDPKFGCLGVFELLTFIVSIFALISALSMSVARHFVVVRKGRKTGNQELTYIAFSAVSLSILCSQAIAIAEYLGVAGAAFTWAIASFIIGCIVLKLNTKI